MKIVTDQNRHLLIVEKDQPLVKSITEFCQQRGLLSGQIHGIGALKNVELGYYELHEKSYIRKTFSDGDYELISLHGNISEKEGKAFVHVHASLGRSDFSVFGGHLFEAQVAVVCEVFITSLRPMIQRQYNEEIGLFLICGEDVRT